MKITVSDMERFAQDFLDKEFNGIKLDIPIELNGRLKVTMGRFHSLNGEPIKIDISKMLVEHNGLKEILDVLHHELVHYVLCKTGQPYDDADKEFIDICNRLDISQNGQVDGHIHYKLKYKVYTCSCNKRFKSLRKLDRYRCSKCKGDLIYVKEEVE